MHKKIFAILAGLAVVATPASAQETSAAVQQVKSTKPVKKTKKAPARRVQRTGTGTEGSSGFLPAIGPGLMIVGLGGAAGTALALAGSDPEKVSPD